MKNPFISFDPDIPIWKWWYYGIGTFNLVLISLVGLELMVNLIIWEPSGFFYFAIPIVYAGVIGILNILFLLGYFAEIISFLILRRPLPHNLRLPLKSGCIAGSFLLFLLYEIYWGIFSINYFGYRD
jgi:hypothetical protein